MTKPCIPVEELTSENYLSGEPSYPSDHPLSCSCWCRATANHAFDGDNGFKDDKRADRLADVLCEGSVP